MEGEYGVTEQAKHGAHGVWTRVIAGLLVLALLAGIVVYRQTEVSVDPEPIENKAVRLAAKELLAENDYANASRLDRMTEYDN